MIAVHCGAGFHSEKQHIHYKKLCNRACRAGIAVLKRNGTSLEALKAALTVLENDPLTNAGYGSNLTTNGKVECDASMMDGGNLVYGGCGAVKNVKNPIQLAYDICVKQLEQQPLALVPPSLLVGKGALDRAKSIGLKVVKNEKLISAKALRQFTKHSQTLKKYKESVRMDTVGAVCVDDNRCMASACSSGGVLLKTPGRVGQAALYGSGVFADSFSKDEASIAISTTGCGEHIMQTQLAREIAEDLKKCSCPITGLADSMTTKFINSKFLHRLTVKNAGALVLYQSTSGEYTVLWGHSTETMSVGYMRVQDQKPKSLISVFPENVTTGTAITVGGSSFYKSSSDKTS